MGKGRKSVSDAIQWLRRKGARLALVTNCRQWRLIYAGLDYEAWCEWDAQLGLRGKSSAQLDGLRLLLQPSLYDLSEGTSVFASLVQDSGKGRVSYHPYWESGSAKLLKKWFVLTERP